MRSTSNLRVLRQTIAGTPRFLGVNLEVQDYAEQLNLWDWLGDSGATVARELHPARFLRLDGYADPRWEEISCRETFDGWREEVRHDPSKRIPRNSILLDQRIPWMGTPDVFLNKLGQAGIQPVISIDYNARTFSQPLLSNLESSDLSDPGINWPAAASAYAYSFALAYYTCLDHGARFFSMMNEPENRFGWFHLPPSLEEQLGENPWVTIAEGDDRSLSERDFRLVANQLALLCMLTRTALDDVDTCLGIGPLRLIGPTNVVWKPFWKVARPWLDSCDVHHYSPDASSFRALYAEVRAEAERKSFSLSEFNRFSGSVPIEESPLNPSASLRLAEVLMEVLKLGRQDAFCEIATLYLFHAPSTHRNHKHLLYGSLDFLDWSGTDRAPWDRSEAWYPTADEMQVRHPTLAYVIFKMLARACRPHSWSGEGNGPYPVRECGIHNPTSADPKAIATHLNCLAVCQPKALFLHILNAGECTVEDVRIEELERRFTTAIIRKTGVGMLDETVEAAAVSGGEVRLSIGPRSFVQVILSELDPATITGFTVEEQTLTPGVLDDLRLWQTTRLRAVAQTPQGPHDVTELCALFNCPDDCLRVTASGLVQRIRESRAMGPIGVGLAGSPLPAVSLGPVR